MNYTKILNALWLVLVVACAAPGTVDAMRRQSKTRLAVPGSASAKRRNKLLQDISGVAEEERVKAREKLDEQHHQFRGWRARIMHHYKELMALLEAAIQEGLPAGADSTSYEEQRAYFLNYFEDRSEKYLDPASLPDKDKIKKINLVHAELVATTDQFKIDKEEFAKLIADITNRLADFRAERLSTATVGAEQAGVQEAQAAASAPEEEAPQVAPAKKLKKTKSKVRFDDGLDAVSGELSPQEFAAAAALATSGAVVTSAGNQDGSAAGESKDVVDPQKRVLQRSDTKLLPQDDLADAARDELKDSTKKTLKLSEVDLAAAAAAEAKAIADKKAKEEADKKAKPADTTGVVAPKQDAIADAKKSTTVAENKSWKDHWFPSIFIKDKKRMALWVALFGGAVGYYQKLRLKKLYRRYFGA